LTKLVLSTLFSFLFLYSFGQISEQTGYCSYYADKFQGRKTASGEVYNKNAFTAAHRTLPFNTVVEVTNLRNQKKVLVKINDRGPNTKNRLLDVSKAAALELDIIAAGVEKVSLKVVEIPPTALTQDTVKSDETENKNIVIKDTENKRNIVYNDNLQPVHPVGYGIQIGYYKNLNNCKNDLIKYQSKYKTKVYFYAELKQENTYYHLIIGEYEVKKDAVKLQTQLKKEIPGCFIINWNNLKDK
jgi:rare lipoprotein A